MTYVGFGEVEAFFLKEGREMQISLSLCAEDWRRLLDQFLKTDYMKNSEYPVCTLHELIEAALKDSGRKSDGFTWRERAAMPIQASSVCGEIED